MVAVSADIRNFFHMINVAEEDIAALRFLFFKDLTMEEIMELESTVHIFGAGSSPPVANFTLKHHAQKIRAKYGDEVFWLILLCFYVDDFLSSFPSVEKAREMRIKLTAALKEGGFDLTKWASSHPEVLIDPTPSPLMGEASLAGVSPFAAVSASSPVIIKVVVVAAAAVVMLVVVWWLGGMTNVRCCTHPLILIIVLIVIPL